MANLNPQILIWARETAGLAPEDAVRRLGLGAARGVAAVERLGAFEAGEAEPTRGMIEKMAEVYRRPLLTFYLSAPPGEAPRTEDFRTLPDKTATGEAILATLLRDVRVRQSLVREVLEDEDEASPLPFVGSMSMRAGRAAVQASVEATLGFTSEHFRAQTADHAFVQLRQKAEAAGVFVLLIGDLGSHHTGLDVETFRGFALADPVAPFVVINDRDARPAWSFTLLHELCHIWLGVTGVSGARGEAEVERFCNDVASAVLLPEAELAELQAVIAAPDLVGLAGEVAAFARARHLSLSMVAYRLFRTGAISELVWEQLRQTFRAQWQEQKAAQQEARREEPGGPSYYIVRRHRLGGALLGVVDRMVRGGALTPTKAARVLGVSPRTVQPLLAGRAV